jgi:WD40 repeat protein
VKALATLSLSDGRVVLASGSTDGTIRLWDIEDGAPIGDPLVGHSESVDALVALSLSDGRVVLASAG